MKPGAGRQNRSDYLDRPKSYFEIGKGRNSEKIPTGSPSLCREIYFKIENPKDMKIKNWSEALSRMPDKGRPTLQDKNLF